MHFIDALSLFQLSSLDLFLVLNSSHLSTRWTKIEFKLDFKAVVWESNDQKLNFLLM